jgi:antitoxin component of MazEF toxin-antitoxin module
MMHRRTHAPSAGAAHRHEAHPIPRRRLRAHARCYYSEHMATVELKVARIGNSRGVRLPAASLRRYRIGETVLMEERSEGILLRPAGPAVEKLSWEETAREMSTSREDWRAWEAAAADGLDDLPWHADRRNRVADAPSRYRAERRPTKRR